MSALIDSIEFPAPTFEARVEWLGERMWDLAEGELSKAKADLVVAAALGWADLCSEAERAAYRQLAGKIQGLREQQ